ncbi:MAG: DUF4265 domain-containing protein [Moraxella sp.]|nr:DUF4265 domain-containing protein [Moraxella sp.]
MVHDYITVYFKNLEDNLDQETLRVIFLDDNRCQIDDIPLFAYNLAKKDIITITNDNGVISFDDFSEFSGNSTLQVVLLNPTDGTRQTIKNALLKFNIEFKYFSPDYFAIHIPKDTDYQPIWQTLKDFEHQELLSFREACLSDKHDSEREYYEFCPDSK